MVSIGVLESTGEAGMKLIMAICIIAWNAPTERIDNTPLMPDEILHYELAIKWVDNWYTIGNVINTQFTYPENPPYECFDCQSIRVRAVDTDKRESDWAYPTCPPQQPITCQ